MFSIRCVLRAACLVAVAVLLSSGAFASSPDKDGWRPDIAEAVQARAARDAAKAVADPAAREARLRALHRRETGFGSSHPPRTDAKDHPLAVLERQRLQDLQQQIAHATRGKADRAALERLLPAPKGGVTMTLRTAETVLDTGGFLYAYNQAGSYVGAAAIESGGLVTLPGAVGDVLDLVVFPSTPFAAQSVEVTLAAGGEVLLRTARVVTVTIQTDNGAPYDGMLGGTLWPNSGLMGFGLYVTLDVSQGAPLLYLLPGTGYSGEFTAASPYLADTDGVAAAGTSWPVFLRQGHVFSAALDDPDSLLQGCTASVDGEATVALPRDGSAGRRLANADIESEDGKPVRMRVTVPHDTPVTLTLSFATNFGGACQIQDWSLEHVRFRDSANERIVLRRRPQPEVVFEMDGGAIGYDYGYFTPVDRPERSQYFTPTYMDGLSLRAGQDYWVNVVTASSVTAAYARTTAVAGPFQVDIDVEPLVRVPVHLHAAQDEAFSNVLLEARRGGALIAALEMGSDYDYELRVPPGDYSIRISGLAGSRYDSVRFESSAVVLRPIAIERSIDADVPQRIDVYLPSTTNGVRFEASQQEMPVHATALDAGVPIGAIELQSWWTALYSDLPQLDLRLRGPGMDDVETRIFPTAARPQIDLWDVAGTSGRLRGTLRDAANAPLPNTPIYFYSEDATFAGYFQSDSAGRFDLPKVRNGLYTFNAPYAGDALTAFLDITDPATTTQQDVRLERATFLSTDRTGPALQRIHGSGHSGFRVVFLAEGYVAQRETFTDSNGNGAWDGVVYLDLDGDGLWQPNEPAQPHGNAGWPAQEQAGTDIASGNEAFNDLNGDGYPNLDDYAVFIDNAKNYVRALLGTPEIRRGLDIDAYVLFLPSAQAGVDVYSADEVLLMERDTRFGASYELSRYLLNIDGTAAIEAIGAAIDTWNLQVVLINQPVAVGRANSFILANGGVGNVSPNNTVAGHEFGHNPGELADEYNEFSGTHVGWISPAVGHLTHVPDDLSSPWSHLLGERADVPVSLPGSPGIGLYAGGYYQAGGVYRPTSNSRMRYNAPHFNAPSNEKMARAFCLLSQPPPVSTSRPPVPPGRIFASEFEPPYRVVALPCR